MTALPGLRVFVVATLLDAAVALEVGRQSRRHFSCHGDQHAPQQRRRRAAASPSSAESAERPTGGINSRRGPLGLPLVVAGGMFLEEEEDEDDDAGL